MSNADERWLSPEDAARAVGMSAVWVRRQIADQRLPATAWSVGARRTYRIREDDWRAFMVRYSRRTDDPDWE